MIGLWLFSSSCCCARYGIAWKTQWNTHKIFHIRNINCNIVEYRYSYLYMFNVVCSMLYVGINIVVYVLPFFYLMDSNKMNKILLLGSIKYLKRWWYFRLYYLCLEEFLQILCAVIYKYKVEYCFSLIPNCFPSTCFRLGIFIHQVL